MTREEAIDFGEMFLQVNEDSKNSNTYKFVSMAIKELKQEPCKDTVNREAAQKAVESTIVKYIPILIGRYERLPLELAMAIKDLPPVTPKGVTVTDFADKCRECGKQKKGKWIIDDEELGRIWHCHCSNCKKDPQDYIGGTENWWLVRLPDYCPNCGVEMESENG